MAIFDKLYLTTDLSEEQSLTLFFQCLGFEADVSYHEQDLSNPFAEARKPDSFVAYAKRLKAESYKPTELGINPTVAIDFRLQKWHIAQEEIMNATNRLLERTNWDIALVHGDSVVILVRKERNLILNKNSGFWTPERIAMISLPFEFQEMANL